MHEQDETRTVNELLGEFARGRLSRRGLLQRAVALGLTAPAFASLMAGASRGALAQNSTVAPGSTIVVPKGLRTDLKGQKVRAVLTASSSPDRPWIEAALKKFSAATGAQAEFIAGEEQTDQRLAIYLQQLGAKSSDVDVYQIDVIHPGILAEHALDLNGKLKDLAATHFQAIVQNNTIKGALVGMPWFTDAGLLYHRTDLLKKYGFENPPATWNDLTTMAQKIQDGERKAGKNDFYGFVFQGNVYEGLTCNGLEWQVSNGGGTIVEPDGKVSINNPQAIAAFERARGWVGKIAPESVTTFREPESLNVFASGNAAFMRNWPYAYALGNSADSPIRAKFDVTVLPRGAGANATNAATFGGHSLAVSRFSRNPKVAADLVVYMTSYEVQAQRAVMGYNPTRPAVYKDAAVLKAAPFVGKMDAVMSSATVRPTTITGDKYPRVSEAFWSAVSSVLSGQSTPEAALSGLESNLNRLKGRNW